MTEFALMTELDLSTIRKLSHQDLHAATLHSVGRERQSSVVVLHHLKEVDRRQLWAKFARSSLEFYCVQDLKYSETQARRRVRALRAIQEMPEVEEKIISGALNLTTVGQAVSFFYQEKKAKNIELSTDEKRSILAMCEHKTQSQVEHELARLSPKLTRPDRMRVISDTHVDLQFSASFELVAMIARLKEILSNKLGDDANLDSVLSHVCKDVLTRTDLDITLAREKASGAKGAHKDSDARNSHAQPKPAAPDRTPDRTPDHARDHAQRTRSKSDEPKVAPFVPARRVENTTPCGLNNSRARDSEAGDEHLQISFDTLSDAASVPSLEPKDSKRASLPDLGLAFPNANAQNTASEVDETPNQTSTQSLTVRLSQETRAETPNTSENAGPNPKRRTQRPRSANLLRTSIRRSTRRLVWRRDGGRCSYWNRVTGERCACRSSLEYDHIVPVALGGTNEPGNIRLYCRAHNRFAARESFGDQHMQRWTS